MPTDRHIQEAVLAEFLWEPSITAAHIGVTADAGVVTLTGHVQTYAEKHAAEEAASRVKGVKAVAQELEVHLPGTMKRGDEEIAKAAVDRLTWEVIVPRDAVKVVVDKGWVTLSGEVNWQFQKEGAERAVRGLMGVVGISNQTKLKTRVNTTNISDDINDALGRSWYDDDKIKVTAVGGKVKLTGSVDSMNERWAAGTTAWASPGATEVENDLVIT